MLWAIIVYRRRKLLLGEPPTPPSGDASFDEDAFDVDAFDAEAFALEAAP